MQEIPESLTRAKQLNDAVKGATVARVNPPSKAHKFCWYAGDPAAYDDALRGASVVAANGFGMYVDLVFSNGQILSLNDGVNLRLTTAVDVSKGYQLMIEWTDGRALIFTVAMYGGIMLHDASFEDAYYLKSKAAVSPFSPDFPAYYRLTLAAAKPTMSVKAFLATEQRFPGVGNGVTQDILFAARLHPKRKLYTLSEEDRDILLDSIVSTLRQMTDEGGRDTESDLYGNPGKYKTIMCKNALASGCPVCGGDVVKEAYMGGSVYYCPACQMLD